MSEFWTHDDITKLRDLWATGESCGKIAEKLGKGRNAVIGKAHRLNLPTRPLPDNFKNKKPGRAVRLTREQKLARNAERGRAHRAKMRAEGQSKPAAVKPRPAPALVTPAAVQTAPGRFMLEEAQLRNGCRWPSGNKPFTFCGSERNAADDPYCAGGGLSRAIDGSMCIYTTSSSRMRIVRSMITLG